MSENKHIVTTLDRSSKADECYTPAYAVYPMLEFLPKDKIYWLPFDEEWSAYNKVLTENGYKTTISHLNTGQDFFEYEPKEWDILISNPPYSKKAQVVKRCYELGKPFALLMPVAALQSVNLHPLYASGLELMVFDARIGFYTLGDRSETKESPAFGTMYFCKDILPEKMIFRKLDKKLK